jgi:hypothetical protein
VAVVVGASDVVGGAAARTGFGDGAGRARVVRFGVGTAVVGATAVVVAGAEKAVTGGGAAVTAVALSGSRSVDAHAVVEATTTTATSPNPAHGSIARIRSGGAVRSSGGPEGGTPMPGSTPHNRARAVHVTTGRRTPPEGVTG